MHELPRIPEKLKQFFIAKKNSNSITNLPIRSSDGKTNQQIAQSKLEFTNLRTVNEKNCILQEVHKIS